MGSWSRWEDIIPSSTWSVYWGMYSKMLATTSTFDRYSRVTYQRIQGLPLMCKRIIVISAFSWSKEMVLFFNSFQKPQLFSFTRRLLDHSAYLETLVTSRLSPDMASRAAVVWTCWSCVCESSLFFNLSSQSSMMSSVSPLSYLIHGDRPIQAKRKSLKEANLSLFHIQCRFIKSSLTRWSFP